MPAYVALRTHSNKMATREAIAPTGTILRDRILSIGLDHPAASQRAFLLKLVKDRKLPADTRMEVAPKCFPPKRTRSFRTDVLVAFGLDSVMASCSMSAEAAGWRQVNAANPCLRLLRLDFCLPAALVGPLLLCEFDRFAVILRCDVIGDYLRGASGGELMCSIFPCSISLYSVSMTSLLSPGSPQ